MAADIPRRIQLTRMTPEELAIRECVQRIEALGADVRLTDAVVLLAAAKDSVSDFIDGVEMRRFVRTEPNAAPPAVLCCDVCGKHNLPEVHTCTPRAVRVVTDAERLNYMIAHHAQMSSLYLGGGERVYRVRPDCEWVIDPRAAIDAALARTEGTV